MIFCDDCKWCSRNFEPTKGERSKYGEPELETKDSRFYTCLHPEASKGARFDGQYCTIMRLNSEECKKDALLFEQA